MVVCLCITCKMGVLILYRQCAGQESSMCTHVLISHGLANPDTIVQEQKGKIECFTSATTLTTLLTSTSSSTVAGSSTVEALSSSTTYSLPSSSSPSSSSPSSSPSSSSPSSSSPSSMPSSSSTSSTSSSSTSNPNLVVVLPTTTRN